MRKLEVDFHGLSVPEAESRLRGLLKHCPPDVSEIHIIHGYHSGQAIKNMLSGFKHKAVERKIVGLNNGVTVIVLKNDR